MIVTTTPSVEGRMIRQYLGIVGGAGMLIAEFKWGIAAQDTESEKTLEGARQQAVRALAARAEALGADAVVGVSFDWEQITARSVVLATGTAVALSALK